jgi:hypothetical protein
MGAMSVLVGEYVSRIRQKLAKLSRRRKKLRRIETMALQ